MKAITLVAMSIFSLFARTHALEPGAAAPEVKSVDQDGAEMRFADFYQKGPTLVYFYPKADTPGCTKQACSLRDSYAGLQARGVQIIGVSGDRPDAQKKFKAKYQLPFTLAADSDGTVAKAFGVPATMGFTKRQSFLINDGKIVWVDLNVSPATHLEKVNAALDALKK